MSLSCAAIFAIESVLIIAAGLLLGRFLARLLIQMLRGHGYTRTSCRATDTARTKDIHEESTRIYEQAREVRLMAESLEHDLKGAAHV